MTAANVLYATAWAGGLMAVMAIAGFLGDGWPKKIVKRLRRRSGRKKEHMEEKKTAEAMLHAALGSKELPETMFGQMHGKKVTTEIRAHQDKALFIFSELARVLAAQTSTDAVIMATAAGVTKAMKDKK